MRKTIIFILFVSVLCGALNIVAAAEERKKIAVFDFDASCTEYPQLGLGVAETLIVELLNNKAYQIIERKELRGVLDEQGLGLSGAIDSSTAIRTGKVLGADYILLGTVLNAVKDKTRVNAGDVSFGQDKAVIDVSARLINSETGEIIFAAKGRGDKSGSGFNFKNFSYEEFNASAWGAASEEAVREIVGKLNKLNPVRGYIIEVDNKDNIYIDLGSSAGVKKGDRFEIYEEGDAIVHPISKKIVAVKKIRLGILKIKEVIDKEVSIGQLEEGSRSKIHKGVRVVIK